MDKQLLQRDQGEGEVERFGLLAVFYIPLAHDGGCDLPAQRRTRKRFLARLTRQNPSDERGEREKKRTGNLVLPTVSPGSRVVALFHRPAGLLFACQAV
jgi:hypothetical protein